MSKPVRTNLTLSHSLTQAQETIFVLSKQLQALQDQSKAKKKTTKKHVMDKKTREKIKELPMDSC